MGSATIQYEALAEQIEAILQDSKAATAQIKDGETRRRLAEGGRKLSVAMEEPRDTVRRFSYVHYQLPLAVVGVETGLFAALAAEPRPFTCAELSGTTGVSSALLKRLLRYYQALDMISQLDNDAYQASNVTHILGNSYQAKAILFGHKIMAPGSLHLPDWLKSIEYKDPLGIQPAAWGSALHTDQHPYAWLGDNPWALDLAIAYMRIQREGRPVFFDALDFEDRFAQGTTDSTVLFVDIGGSTGPQSIALRERYPNLPGRVIIQDRPEVVQQAKQKLDSSSNIDVEVYDIFTPQTIKGARTYYLRNIFHAWADPGCVEILVNIKSGMTEESVILIDETILPEKGVKPRGAQHDLEVMTSIGAKERTKAEWERLIEDAGLKLREVVRYDEEYEDCVLIAVL